VLERLGFALEGVLRSFMPSSIGPRDYALYAITDNDWKTLKETWTRPS
jgi:RimJ/RimL family protein N-acetyltransferase